MNFTFSMYSFTLSTAGSKVGSNVQMWDPLSSEISAVVDMAGAPGLPRNHVGPPGSATNVAPRVRVHKGRETGTNQSSGFWGSYPKRKFPLQGSYRDPLGLQVTCYTSRFPGCPQRSGLAFAPRGLSHAPWHRRSLRTLRHARRFVHPRLFNSHWSIFLLDVLSVQVPHLQVLHWEAKPT